MSVDRQREYEKMKARENSFDLNGLNLSQRSEYNAIFDPNMRHYFENKKIQKHLYLTGQIDRHGRVIDLQKNKSKVLILEREFKEAEKVEERRMKEEMEMRYRVQKKRFNDLEAMRKKEILHKLKFDREIGKEIVSILKESTTLTPTRHSSSSLSRSGECLMKSSAFITTDKDITK